MKMCPVVHFEMPAQDKKRMATFYTQAFGWQMKFWGPEMSEYVSVTTTKVGKNGRPERAGAINGGFFQRTADKNSHYPSIVIAVEDIQVAMVTVKHAGGKVIDQPVNIPGVGLYVSIIDTEGNRISLLQPTDMK